MSFKSIFAPAIGIGSLGGMMYSQYQQFKVFVPTVFPDTDEAGISLSSYTGAFLGSLPIDIQEVALTEMEFRYGDIGAIDFKLSLNQDPPVPILRFTEVVFSIGVDKIFKGYVWKYPGPDKKMEDAWEYSGFGMGKRLEKAPIKLKPDVDIYQIDSIEQRDDITTRIHLSIPLADSDVVDRVCFVNDAEDDNNNGRFDVSAVDPDFAMWIEFVNPAGLDQALNKGLLTILPKEWSDPTTTISDLIKQVVSNYLGDLPISSAVGNISPSPAMFTGAILNLDNLSLSEFFKQIRMAVSGWDFFIDADSVVVFRERSSTHVAILIIGYDVHDAKNTRNDDDVVNRWTVNRKLGKEEDRVGFETGGIAQDATSIKNFGLFADDQDVPVYYGDALCTAMAQELVNQTKDPKDIILINNAPFRNYPIGPWKIITSPRAQESEITGCEDIEGWDFSGPLTPSIETTNLVFGAGALRVEYDADASGSTFIFNTLFYCIDPVFLRFWYKGKRIGQKMKFAFGDTSLDFESETLSKEVFVYSTRYRRLDIPLQNVSIGRMQKLGFRIENPLDDDFFLVDEISIYSTVSNHKILDLKEVKIHLGDRRYCDLIFGALPSRMEDYLAGVFRTVKMAKLALKE